MTTKGSSEMNPIRYEKDAITQVWIDRRKLATACAFMERGGNKPLHISEIIRFCVDVVSELVERQGGLTFDKTAEAVDFLNERFGDTLNPRGKGRKNLMNNLLLDSGYTPGPVLPSRPTSVSIEDVNPFSSLDIEEMKKKSRQQFGDALTTERLSKDLERTEEEKRAFESLGKGEGEGND